jgi:carbon storage regulator
MLVLSRKVNEAIAIGDNIRVMVVGVKNGVVRLGFDVPDAVDVLRTELLAKTKFDMRAQRAQIGRSNNAK